MTRRGRWMHACVLILVLAGGVAARVWGVSARPFWADEAWVAYAATHQSYGELMRQTELPVPPLFAVGVKLLGEQVRPPELGLRLLPLLSGIAVLPLMYAILRKLRTPRTVALAGLTLCASSPMLLIWSRELKQYAVEALLAVLLAWLVFSFRRCASTAGRWWFAAGILGVSATGPWLGYGAVFPAVTLLGVLLVLRPESGGRRAGIFAGAAGLIALAVSVAAVLHVAAASQAGNPALVAFTSNWYIRPLDVHDWLRAGACACLTSAVTCFPYEWTAGAADLEHLYLTAFLAAGFWGLALAGLATWPGRARAALTAWVLGPWLLTLAAAIAGQYPFGVPRMMVFWAPPFVVATAAGLIRLTRVCSTVFLQRSGPGALVGLLLAVAMLLTVPLRERDWVYHDFPAIIEALGKEHRPGEPIVVMSMAEACVRCYIGDELGPVVYTPTTAGTLSVQGFDYRGFIARTIREAGPRWWVLTTTGHLETRRDLLVEIAAREGYSFEVAARSPREINYGAAALLRVTRTTYRP